MDMHHLKMGLTFLLVAGLTACGGGGGNTSLPKAADIVTPQRIVVPRTASSMNATALPASAYTAIDVGGPATGNWLADTGFSGGNIATIASTINTNNVTAPAPQAVYQSQRWASQLTYTLSSLTPRASYNVRLHFVESYFRTAGSRVFSTSINGKRVLNNFDIYAAAGGANIATVRSYSTNADGTGNIKIAFVATVNNASIAGIEATAASNTPTPTPTPAPASGFGPRVPVGPQASITCPPSAVQISPGSNVQSVVNAHSAGTTYCLASGTYTQQKIVPRSGDTYIGIKGATLDGQNIAVHAFSGAAVGATIKNLIIKNYNTASQDGAINNRQYGYGSNWVIANDEISNNSASGILVNDGTSVVANYLHNNAQEGYSARGTGITFTDNEIANNNPTGAFDPSNEAGGGKAWATINLIMEYNYSHDNHGPGLWTDTDNQGTVYEYNDVENNWEGGIEHEFSWDATIAHNLVKNNGNSMYCSGDIWCSGIEIKSSGGVNGKIIDVLNNTIVSNNLSGAVALISEDSSTTGLYGPCLVQNVHVHNNNANMSVGGYNGATISSSSNEPGLYSSQGNSFNGDAYTGAGSNAFEWNNNNGNFSFFQSQSQEMNGTSQ
jgi:hypothetical protein